MAVTTTEWGYFFSIVVILLSLDLGIFNRNNEVISFKKSLALSGFYILIACIFGLWINKRFGSIASSEYFTGFLLEKSMSVDNIFVIATIFKFFKIPPQYQHRVLFWGIIGVIILRAIMIFSGATLLQKFDWLLYVFALLLIFTGVKMLIHINDTNHHIGNSYLYKLLTKRLNVHDKLIGEKFFIYKKGKIFVTPLFLSLITIETMDLVFAIDSIPAIFAVTQNIFIVYTSNIFAILGLRALFFCISNLVERFRYIKYSLSIILILIAVKILVSHYIKISPYIPLFVTMMLLLIGLLASIIFDKKRKN
ncbi:MAG: TerC/Alx family metal homeostasis membrane protein [Rickettsiaceae bacterium]|nr:TerC/Alx family metal homeostasis membrane protein [Rickettsiaceae bacterium]